MVYVIVFQSYNFIPKIKFMSVHQFLKEIRIKNGYKQQQIAEILGIDTTSYGRIERGDRKLNTERLVILAKHYNISVSALLSNAEILAEKPQETPTNNEFVNYLKEENSFLRNSIMSKDKQLDFLIEITKEYKKLFENKK